MWMFLPNKFGGQKLENQAVTLRLSWIIHFPALWVLEPAGTVLGDKIRGPFLDVSPYFGDSPSQCRECKHVLQLLAVYYLGPARRLGLYWMSPPFSCSLSILRSLT